MSRLFDGLGASGAWVAALAAAHGSAAAAPAVTYLGALDALRSAQVEAYCDHDQAALQAMRRARALLLAAPGGDAALTALDEASWHLRRHESAQAQAALEQARERLA